MATHQKRTITSENLRKIGKGAQPSSDAGKKPNPKPSTKPKPRSDTSTERDDR